MTPPAGGRAPAHYAGIALLMSVGGIVFLTWTALTYEGNDLAQVGILIGLLGSVSTGILGFMSGLVLGRHISESEQRGGPEATSSSPG